jgi:hypothetical protein
MDYLQYRCQIFRPFFTHKPVIDIMKNPDVVVGIPMKNVSVAAGIPMKNVSVAAGIPIKMAWLSGFVTANYLHSVFLISLILLLSWRIWRFTMLPVLRPDDPKEVPYWIPCGYDGTRNESRH